MRVTLEIEPGGEAPRGRMLVAGQPECEFHGYVQLISALQAALEHGEPTIGDREGRVSGGERPEGRG